MLVFILVVNQKSVIVAPVSAFVLAIFFQGSASETVDQPLSPREAAASMRVPAGFQVTLFAGEPDVVQPIDFSIDSRGRLWVCEARSYPKHTEKPAGDRILIFEDTDHDGKHDKRTVFYDQLNYVTGIEVGFGGIWVMSPPHFFFIPDRDGDDVPDGEPEVALDGFGNHANSHNLANGFEWGPDGWLYGTHGRTNWSMIGKPGTPDEDRVRFDGGVWRFDPVTKKWESFCDGTTNPWGIDWDEHGEAFMTNCVNPHLFHAIPGAHYEPWRGRESSRHAYRRIQTIADHLHYAGKDIRGTLDLEETLALGGGHAHCGVLVYPHNGPWPARYRGAVLINNIHGDRINCDRPARFGSGFTASHAPDLMIARDPWFMGVALQLGPDGSVFVSDWSDTGECHSVRNTRKKTGRIYKIVYMNPKMPDLNLYSKSNLALAELALSENRFIERHARRILWERTSKKPADSHLSEYLRTAIKENETAPQKLKALWALRCIGALNDEYLAALTGPESVKAWAIRLACEDGQVVGPMWGKLLAAAQTKAPPRVHLHLISGAMRLPAEQRWQIVEALSAGEIDPDDPNLPLMLWYLAHPLIDDDFHRFVDLAKSPISLFREHVARRVASESEQDRALEGLIAIDTHLQKEIITGIIAGLEGVREMKMPRGWEAAFLQTRSHPDPEVEEKAIQLALIFDDPKALRILRDNSSNPKLPAGWRNRSLNSLLQKRIPDLGPLLLSLIDDEKVRATAIRGLAEYQQPETANRILDQYVKLSQPEKQDALQTLASRPEWAAKLLDAVEAKEIPRSDLSAFTARQIINLNDESLSGRVRKTWGELRQTSEKKQKQIDTLRKKLNPDSIAQSDPAAGRNHFQSLCAACHKMFGEGGEAGPELTGSQRTNLDYLLENLIDPSASVSKDFQMQIITTTGDRVVSGFSESESEAAVVIRSINERIVIPRNEIKSRSYSEMSMMPEGLLNALTTMQLRELFAYLSSPRKVGGRGAAK